MKLASSNFSHPLVLDSIYAERPIFLIQFLLNLECGFAY